jgi:chromosome segregation ATPase
MEKIQLQLNKAMSDRDFAQAKLQEYEGRLADLEAEMEKKQQNVQEAIETARQIAPERVNVRDTIDSLHRKIRDMETTLKENRRV